MTSITINLSDLEINKLTEKAEQLELSLEECVKISINHWLTDMQPDFIQAAGYVLNKNCELYERLAWFGDREIQASVDEQEKIIFALASGEINREIFTDWLNKNIQIL